MHHLSILFSNIGYAKGINGYLSQHILNANRHFYCSKTVQHKSLHQLKTLINRENPDICCLVEVEKGSLHSSYYNQIESLTDQHYTFYDIANKYGKHSLLRHFSLYQGRCNAFLAKHPLPFERHYLTHGAKRLLYHLRPYDGLHIFFGHFSLQEKVRKKQFDELAILTTQARNTGEVIILGDFNILTGPTELSPLLEHTSLHLLNRETEHTFTFHRRKLMLDLCLCSPAIASHSALRIIKQPFSDHDALLLEIAL